jgi:hypothetical protein
MLNGNNPTSSLSSVAGDPRRYPARVVAYAAAIAAFAGVMASGIVKCPMAVMFHLPCPACGSTRAARALLTLDVPTALHFNPVAPLVLAALAGLTWRALTLVFREGHARRVDEERLGRLFLRIIVWGVAAQTLVWGARFFGLFGGPCPV